MVDPQGFIKVERIENRYRPIDERVHDYFEVETQMPEDMRKFQASRCMDCGVPFCHWACPVGSLIPEWQDKLHQGDWRGAYEILQKTNNFPEFTGRLCPAPCEMSCVLGINDDPVTIRENELSVIERAFAEGYVKAHPPQVRTGKTVAVIGSGPAGMACADSLNKAGHTVTLYEAADQVGGYLRYGVPDFKLEKRFIDRRVDLMLEEGLIIRTGVRVGVDVAIQDLVETHDAVCITIGAREARDLPIEGRDLNGIYPAMHFLEQSNRSVRGETFSEEERITARGKHVVVIGGGDTGSDCVGTANRQGAKSITQIELLPAPPRQRALHEPWPLWAKIYKTTSSHEEGCTRLFNVQTQRFMGKKGAVRKLSAVQVEWTQDANGRWQMREVPGSEFEQKAELVLLAMGFVHIEQDGMVNDLGVDLDARGNIAVDTNFMTSIPGVFAAGDSTRGASLVVWAISEGRAAATHMDKYLKSLG
jgi:glutamate synthase (NADPH/NADH) small chain